MPVPKIVITYDEEGNEYKRFVSVKETASYFNKATQLIYNYTSRNNYFAPVEENGKKFNLRFVQAKPEILKNKELEDQIRRKWGLNPYGDWRNDEWIYAMVDRVNAELEKTASKTYDPINKAYQKSKKREIEGVYVDTHIDGRNLEL